ncbi:hypothetical protein PQC55_gp040 [Escherichia phage vB_EcoP-CHD5UKE1]|uniref:Uncharacterized protein n=1 Tax=Escherichia phage vB_EcoP-CHD5UKE1 TaxID=2865805 RepID=A0ABX9AFL8_9CAUD|nr:hypothetical protein PQC55_gp040 [Escherichia phage vB_EcoP-CHD5UKE1]QZI80536.1 hypothetical protein CHD5UKE1_0040 [Escherichia phage vB_EcoP-CHD5UKE1]WIW36210.1 hypothetical protein [Escherichia phage pEC-N1203-2Af.1]
MPNIQACNNFISYTIYTLLVCYIYYQRYLYYIVLLSV